MQKISSKEHSLSELQEGSEKKLVKARRKLLSLERKQKETRKQITEKSATTASDMLREQNAPNQLAQDVLNEIDSLSSQEEMQSYLTELRRSPVTLKVSDQKLIETKLKKGDLGSGKKLLKIAVAKWITSSATATLERNLHQSSSHIDLHSRALNTHSNK